MTTFTKTMESLRKTIDESGARRREALNHLRDEERAILRDTRVLQEKLLKELESMFGKCRANRAEARISRKTNEQTRSRGSAEKRLDPEGSDREPPERRGRVDAAVRGEAGWASTRLAGTGNRCSAGTASDAGNASRPSSRAGRAQARPGRRPRSVFRSPLGDADKSEEVTAMVQQIVFQSLRRAPRQSWQGKRKPFQQTPSFQGCLRGAARMRPVLTLESRRLATIAPRCHQSAPRGSSSLLRSRRWPSGR